MSAFLNEYNLTFILMAIVSIGIGIGFVNLRKWD